MKVELIQSIALSFPLKRPIKTNLHILNEIDCISLSILESSTGISGNSFIRGFGLIRYEAVKEKIDKLSELVINQNVLTTIESWNKFWYTYKQNKSVTEIYALAALDIAVWDLFAKLKKCPLYELISKESIKKIPIYGTT